MNKKTLFFACVAMFASTSVFADVCHFSGQSAEGVIQSVPPMVRRPQHRPPETKEIKYYDIERSSKDPRVREELTQKFCDVSFEQIRTSAGMLTSISASREKTDLYLNDKVIFSAQYVDMFQTYLEKKGYPSLVLVDMGEGQGRYVRAPRLLRILDVGVTPPFLSDSFIPVMPKTHNFKGHPTDFNYVDILDVKKENADTFIISGLLFDKACDNTTDKCEIKDKNGKPVEAVYKYDRKTRTVTKIK